MPIYEYFCPDNNRIYQFFAKTLAQAQAIPKCPDNPAFRMVKMMSAFAVGGGTKKSAAGEGGAAASGEGSGPGGDAAGESGAGGMGGGGGGDDARMEAAFSEMEQEMGSIDENDPRAMGRMMRRMSELTGEKLDGEMEEMVRKLEEGQDPEKLEEQMGAVPGEGDEAGMGDDGDWGGGGFDRAPSRDPQLYDY